MSVDNEVGKNVPGKNLGCTRYHKLCKQQQNWKRLILHSHLDPGRRIFCFCGSCRPSAPNTQTIEDFFANFSLKAKNQRQNEITSLTLWVSSHHWVDRRHFRCFQNFSKSHFLVSSEPQHQNPAIRVDATQTTKQPHTLTPSVINTPADASAVDTCFK